MNRGLKMLTFQAAALVSSALMLSGVAAMSRAAPAPAPAPAAVQIGNFTFNSKLVTVKAGTTVTWTNADDIPHTVVSKDGLFKSKVLDTGDRFSFTFAKAGQFGYFCSLHPHMTGTIVVRA
ncbi:cupredoxin domain-containing protein [Sphingomonas agri]|uniref:cupredoxin domain-containing protein n=1 Tax=Sphingomonas agri TaxID=1813878 RepID=UPI00311ECF78